MIRPSLFGVKKTPGEQFKLALKCYRRCPVDNWEEIADPEVRDYVGSYRNPQWFWNTFKDEQFL